MVSLLEVVIGSSVIIVISLLGGVMFPNLGELEVYIVEIWGRSTCMRSSVYALE